MAIDMYLKKCPHHCHAGGYTPIYCHVLPKSYLEKYMLGYWVLLVAKYLAKLAFFEPLFTLQIAQNFTRHCSQYLQNIQIMNMNCPWLNKESNNYFTYSSIVLPMSPQTQNYCTRKHTSVQLKQKSDPFWPLNTIIVLIQNNESGLELPSLAHVFIQVLWQNKL